MFFILSKTLSYLTTPYVVICLCFLLSVFIKNIRWKKRLFWIALGGIFFFSNDFIANEVMKAWEVDPIAYKDISKKYRYGIVLTGVTISELKPDDRTYFHRGADRVVHAVQLYKMGHIEKILISGGSGRLLDIGEREADDIKQVMMVMGVKEEDMITEITSRNTHESALEVKTILAQRDIKAEDCMLITSAFHMRRSIACFRKVGLNMDVFSTDFFGHVTKFTPDILFIPKIGAMTIWHIIIKEWVGMVAYKMAGYI